MSDTMRLTDDAIRLALTPAATVHAPAGLGDEIRAATDLTPQRSAGLFGRAASRRSRLVLQLALVGLLVLGLIGALLLVGSPRPPRSLPIVVSTYHGGPERNGIMPGPGPKGAPRLEWQVNLKGPVGGWSPVVVDGSVYLGDEGGFVTAVDESTGTVRWQQDVGAPINSGASVADGMVLLGDDAGVLHALDAATGTAVWTYHADGPIRGATAIVDGIAYVGSLGGHLAAFDVANGRPRWPAPVGTGGSISRAIAVADGIIYAGSGGASATEAGTLGAYDAATGAVRWKVPLEPGNTSTPTVADGQVYVTTGLDIATTAKHGIFALDAKTGSKAWAGPFRAPSGKNVYLGAVADGQVYAESSDGNLYVLDATTGGPAWQIPIGATTSPNGGIVGGVFYATSDDQKIHAIDSATHSELWAFKIMGYPAGPAIVDGRILVGTALGKLVSVVGSGSGSSPGPTDGSARPDSLSSP